MYVVSLVLVDVMIVSSIRQDDNVVMSCAVVM